MIFLNKNVRLDIEIVQSGIKSKNIVIFCEILICFGKNFDQFVWIQSKLVDDFSYDVIIVDEVCLFGDEKVVDIVIENFFKFVSCMKELSFLILLKVVIMGGNC